MGVPMGLWRITGRSCPPLIACPRAGVGVQGACQVSTKLPGPGDLLAHRLSNCSGNAAVSGWTGSKSTPPYNAARRPGFLVKLFTAGSAVHRSGCLAASRLPVLIGASVTVRVCVCVCFLASDAIWAIRQGAVGGEAAVDRKRWASARVHCCRSYPIRLHRCGSAWVPIEGRGTALLGRSMDLASPSSALGRLAVSIVYVPR